MKKLKTSTKNTLLAGAFTVLTSIIGAICYYAGENIQTTEIQNTVQQSGLININKDDSSIDIVNELLNEYIDANNQLISLNKSNSELQIENNNLQIKNNELSSVIKNLQNDLDKTLSENESLRSQIIKIKQNTDIDENFLPSNDQDEHTVILENLVKIDSSWFEIINRFVDLYGNTYPLVYKFDASSNGFAEFELNEEYNQLTGYITLGQNISNDASITIEIYGDDYKLLKKIENISKSTKSEPIFLDSINVSGVKKLTINSYNRTPTLYGYVYLTNVELK